MNSTICKPSDLAEYVFEELPDSGTKHVLPSIEVLITFFEVLFYTSLDTEEGDQIKVTATLFNPQGAASIKSRSDRWRFVKFANEIPFEINTLVKLSKAADPWSSSLAVYYDNNEKLWIYGLIDQALHVQSFLNYEIDDKPDQPGLFQASITDVGCISVLRDYKLIATLKKDSLVTKYVDVLKSGVISNVLKENSASIKEMITEFIDEKYPNESWEIWENLFDSIWQNTIARLLIQIKNYHHGGALLISENESNLNVKYEISYKRLATSIKLLVQQSIKEQNYLSLINECDQTLDLEVFNNYQNSRKMKKNAKNDLKAAIRFVASHSCVDGLILLDGKLNTKGFGVLVTELTGPSEIYVSTSTTGKPSQARNPKHFGTRHQSMFAYCFENPGSIGFVVSQDGDIRAITRVHDKLLVWENIKTQQFIKASPLVSVIKTKKF